MEKKKTEYNYRQLNNKKKTETNKIAFIATHIDEYTYAADHHEKKSMPNLLRHSINVLTCKYRVHIRLRTDRDQLINYVKNQNEKWHI